MRLRTGAFASIYAAALLTATTSAFSSRPQHFATQRVPTFSSRSLETSTVLNYKADKNDLNALIERSDNARAAKEARKLNESADTSIDTRGLILSLGLLGGAVFAVGGIFLAPTLLERSSSEPVKEKVAPAKKDKAANKVEKAAVKKEKEAAKKEKEAAKKEKAAAKKTEKVAAAKKTEKAAPAKKTEKAAPKKTEKTEKAAPKKTEKAEKAVPKKSEKEEKADAAKVAAEKAAAEKAAAEKAAAEKAAAEKAAAEKAAAEKAAAEKAAAEKAAAEKAAREAYEKALLQNRKAVTPTFQKQIAKPTPSGLGAIKAGVGSGGQILPKESTDPAILEYLKKYSN